MNAKLKRHILLITVFTALMLPVKSQIYTHTAKITDIEKKGYYKIYLPPEITSHLHHGFPDIRLLDEKNNEIQYILKQEKTIYDKGIKNKFKILKNKHKKFKHFTEIIIENTKNTEISNMIFRVKNTHNPVFIKISGSNDEKNWYILRNNYPAVPELSNADTTEIKVFNFPRSNFKYYKILFHDYDEQSIEVSSIYYHNLSDIRAEYVPLPKPDIVQKDTADKSILTIEFQKPQFIDMLTFGIYGPEFYLRKVHMQKKDTLSDAVPGETFYDQMNKDFWFGSLKSNRINLADYKAQKIVFIIDNKDNQPLKIYKVNAYQLKNYLTAYLEPDKKYRLVFGSKSAGFPSYDLPYFKDTIPDNIPEAYIYSVKKRNISTKKTNKIWNFPVKYLWISLGFTVIILLIISILLIKQNYKNKKS